MGKPYSEDLRARAVVAEQPDITLAEIKAVLATEKVTVGQSSICRFLHHLNLRFKKVCGPPSRTGRTSLPHVRPCRNSSQGLIPRALSLSTKPAPPQRLPASTGGHRRANGLSKRCRPALGLHSNVTRTGSRPWPGAMLKVQPLRWASLELRLGAGI
jgi:hypothetical protein